MKSECDFVWVIASVGGCGVGWKVESENGDEMHRGSLFYKIADQTELAKSFLANYSSSEK